MGVSVNETPEKRDGNTEFTEIGTQRAQSQEKSERKEKTAKREEKR